MNKPLQSFQEAQLKFTSHIRDPDNHPPPDGIEDRRLKIYRELFFNNINGFLKSGFPVLFKILPQKQWLKLVRAFFSNHQCQSPYFRDIAKEFLQYLQDDYKFCSDDPVWLLELAHYEWVELALFTMKENQVAVDQDGDLLQKHPVVSSLAWPLAYHYPVHKISPAFLPDSSQQILTFLIVYRDRQNQVKFLLSNQVTVRLLHLLNGDASLTGEDALLAVASELQHPQPEKIIAGGLQTLTTLQQKGIILGTSG